MNKLVKKLGDRFLKEQLEHGRTKSLVDFKDFNACFMEIEKLEKKLDSARKVVEFYGSKFNWSSCGEKIKSDLSETMMQICGGMIARQWLEENEVKK